MHLLHGPRVLASTSASSSVGSRGGARKGFIEESRAARMGATMAAFVEWSRLRSIYDIDTDPAPAPSSPDNAFDAAQVAAFEAAQLELAEVDQAERACSADEEVASPDGHPYIFSHI